MYDTNQLTTKVAQTVIPELNQSGVLPPFISELNSTDPNGMAPYLSSISEFVYQYATSVERINILKGLLDYRRKLKSIDITDGFQWIDGSFVENVEFNRGRPPADVDLVTFAFRPTEIVDEWKALVKANEALFNPQKSKDVYLCDAYFVDLNIHPFAIVNSTKYWFGLFSHQRESYLWKGMIKINLLCDDDEAYEILKQEENHA